jgi:hypothetical protein
MRADYNLNTNRIYCNIPHGIATEQDVVNLSTMFLLPPIIAAIDALYPGRLTQYSEQDLDHLRVDHSIRTKEQGKREAVMLIEYKRCCLLHVEEFTNAMCDREDLGAKLDELKRENYYSTLDRSNNAYWIVKQATAYSKRTKCRYVALCDWERLILIRFQRNGKMDSAEVTIVPRSLFRKALLGFLIEACQDANV